jgi:hypothetical protein
VKKPSPALVVAVIAIVLACAGGASAASKLITGKDIKNSSVTGADIRNGSIGNADIEEGSIGTSRLALSLQDAIDRAGTPGPQGAAGPQGPAGPQGRKGDPGPSATSGLTTQTGSLVVASGGIDGGTVYCASGQRAVSGGFYSDGGFVYISRPSPDRSGWQVALDNTGYPTRPRCSPATPSVPAAARPSRRGPAQGSSRRRPASSRG